MPFDVHRPGVSAIAQGLLGVILSLIMWRLTGIFWAWAVLFLPGSILIFYGLYLGMKDK